jgi:hypothetical protein
MVTHILDLRFHKTGDADLCPDFDLRGCNLAVAAVPAQIAVLFHLTVAAGCRGIVTKHIQGSLTGMEAILASFGLRFFILLADLILEASALEVLVEAFVGCNAHFFPFFLLLAEIALRFFAKISQSRSLSILRITAAQSWLRLTMFSHPPMRSKAVG